VKGDISISNTSLTFSNSSLTVDGCIYLKNETQINVDLSQNKNKQNTMTLMTSTKNCLKIEGTISIHLSNKGPCDEVLTQQNTESLSLIFHLSTFSSSISQKLWMISILILSNILF